ncbi:phosphoinositide phosphatase SAC6-like protein, partial [Tanacetum coccineum]
MLKKADPSEKLYTRMRLWELNESYVVEPTDGSSGSCLSVSRLNGSISLLDEVPNSSGGRAQPKVETIFGVVGILKLFAGSYLFVITERECVGSYLGHPIFKVSKLKVLPCDLSVKNSPEEQKKMESEFSSVLKVAETTPGLYFSYDVNITLSAQRLNDLGDESRLLPLWRQASEAEPRFLWNNYMLEVLIDNKLDHYMLPVIQGTFQNFQSAIGKDTIDVTLIARRCTRRTGTRMWRRGADSDGYVANFVESEQIVHVNGFTASFVQSLSIGRNTMPFMWEQIVDLTYKPKFEIVKPEEAVRKVEAINLDLRKKYGNVIAVDLVNKDYTVPKGVNTTGWNSTKYFLINDKGEKVEAQIGVVRTNCIDCLDRTNVTQTRTNSSQFLEILDDGYKSVLWANHGDDISLQYSGTPALKGDFV